jgi:uncharacterized delta-60 repeat protein
LFTSGYFSSSANFLEQAEFSQSGSSAKDIIIAGQAVRGSTTCCGADFVIAGLNSSDGSLDTNFGTSGTTVVNFGCSASTNPIHSCCGSVSPSYDSAYSLVCYEQGNTSAPWVIYGVGVTNFTGSGNEFALDRYTQDGKLDTTFQYHGLQVSYTGAAGTAGGSTAYAGGLQGPNDFDSGDKILAAGAGSPGSTSSDFVVARYNLDGSLDTTFGSNGSIATDLAKNYGSTGNYNTGYDIALGVGWDNADKTIVAGGWSASSSTANGNIALAEYIDNQVVVNFGSSPPPPSGAAAVFSASSIAGLPAADDILLTRHRRRPHLVLRSGG